jgi:hypothetical protein
MGALPRWLVLLVALVAVLVVAALFFAIARALLAAVARLFRGGPGCDRGGIRPARRAGEVRCADEKCRASNAPGAQYCARCGRPLPRAD